MYKRQCLGAMERTANGSYRLAADSLSSLEAFRFQASRGSAGMAALVAATAILTGGCGDETPRPAANAAQQQRMDARAREDTFRYAANLLNSPDTLNVDPTVKERQSITQGTVRLIYGNTPAAVIEQLNRWLMTQKPAADWKPDPLVAGLPEAVRKLKSIENLGDMRFATIDGAALREAVWLRSISNLACSDAISALDRANGCSTGRCAIFNWIPPSPTTSRQRRFRASPGTCSCSDMARPKTAPGCSCCWRGNKAWMSCYSNRRAPSRLLWSDCSTPPSKTEPSFICSTRGWGCRFPARKARALRRSRKSPKTTACCGN